MRRSGRLLAIGFLALVFLAANGFAAVVAHTLLAGERVEAEIVSCSTGGKGSTSCTARWTGADGREHTDGVTGAGASDVHERLAVRTGFAGTFTDDFHAHMWVRSIFAIAVDAGLIGAVFLLLRIRRRGPAAVARLTAVEAPVFELGANVVRRYGGGDVYTVEDVDRGRMRFVDPHGVERWRVRGEDHPGRASVLVVTDTEGNPVGSVRQEAATSAVNILGADGAHLARVDYRRVHRVPGVRYLGTAGDQPAVAVSSRGAMVVRFDPEAPEALRVLVFAQLQGAGWLSMSRFRRKVEPRG
ncbi:MAG TPA: hypothetical protein VGF17_20420 [Phytomonospora sp.]